MTLQEKRKHCTGCRDNYYNTPGNSTDPAGCWGLKSARLILRKRVSMDQRPPWTQKAVKVLSCRRERGYVFVGKNQTC